MAQSAQATIDPTIDMDPASGFAFAPIDAGAQATQTVTVTNPGPDDVVFASDPAQSVTLAGTIPASSRSPTTPAWTRSSQRRHLLVRHDLPADRPRSTPRRSSSSRPRRRSTTTRSRAPACRVAPASASRPELHSPVGMTSPSQPVTITNDGNADDDHDISFLPACSPRAAAARRPISRRALVPDLRHLHAGPSGPGATRSISITYDGAPGSPQTVTLSGTGTQAVINVSPASSASQRSGRGRPARPSVSSPTAAARRPG